MVPSLHREDKPMGKTGNTSRQIVSGVLALAAALGDERLFSADELQAGGWCCVEEYMAAMNKSRPQSQRILQDAFAAGLVERRKGMRNSKAAWYYRAK